MKKLPLLFILTVPLVMSCEIMPRNTISDCQLQCDESNKKKACMDFCKCIHVEGKTLDSCLAEYDRALADSLRTDQ